MAEESVLEAPAETPAEEGGVLDNIEADPPDTGETSDGEPSPGGDTTEASGLPDDLLKEHKTLGKFKDVNDLGNAYAALEKENGRIRREPQEVSEYSDKVIPEGMNHDLVKPILESMLEQNMTEAQATAMLTKFDNEYAEPMAEIQKELLTEKMSIAWGLDKEALEVRFQEVGKHAFKMGHSKQEIVQMGRSELGLKYLDAMMRADAGKGQITEAGGGASAPTDLREEAKKIMETEGYRNGSDTKAHERVNDLYDQIEKQSA